MKPKLKLDSELNLTSIEKILTLYPILWPGRVGRDQVDLLQAIKKDLKQHDITLSSYVDVIKLRQLAIWHGIVIHGEICTSQKLKS
jgi:hypothetical protein